MIQLANIGDSTSMISVIPVSEIDCFSGLDLLILFLEPCLKRLASVGKCDRDSDIFVLSCARKYSLNSLYYLEYRVLSTN